MKTYHVYILSNKPRGALYIGVTGNLIQRLHQHKQESFEGFTKKYKLKRLVYFEECGDIQEAILREKRIKKWNREWKIRVIEEFNEEWKDLSEDWS